MSLSPQSDEEIAPILAALRVIDVRFDVVWDPRAIIEKRGFYDANGKLVAPTYRGLWELRLTGVERQHQLEEDAHGFVRMEWRNYERVCHVTKPIVLPGGMPAMEADGEYAPLGEWFVQFMQHIDYVNHEGMRVMLNKATALNDKRREDAENKQDEKDVEAHHVQFHHQSKEAGISKFHPNRMPQPFAGVES